MPRKDKYTAWCCGCGKIWEEVDNTAYSLLTKHQRTCSLNKELDAYFSANSDIADEVKSLLPWFNSFKTLQEYLKNEEDISKIDRKGFYHESNVVEFQSRWKDVFEKLRRRGQKSASGNSAENNPSQYTNISSITLDLRSADPGLEGGTINTSRSGTRANGFREANSNLFSRRASDGSSNFSDNTKERLERVENTVNAMYELMRQQNEQQAQIIQELTNNKCKIM